MKRPVVAVVTDFLPPATRGGAMRALNAMLDALRDEVEFHVITRDHDALTGEPLDVPGAGNWIDKGGIKVLRLPQGAVSVRSLVQAIIFVQPDVIYANSLFSRLTQRVLLARWRGYLPRLPFVLAPEGELDPGALRIKPLRKRVWIGAARRLRLADGLTWRAANRQEAIHIESVMPGARVAVLPYLPAPLPSLGRHATKTAGMARLLFLSRITPKKNLDFLLEALRRSSIRADLTIVGPVEDEAHWAKCQAIIAALPKTITANYAGPCAPDTVWPFYQAADAFVLPTLGENYGYVIEDALRAGCPPVISDHAPWQHLTETGAGFVLPLDMARWVDALSLLAAMDETGHSALRQRCMDAVATPDTGTGLAAAYVSLFSGRPSA